MASSREYRDFVSEQLVFLENVTVKPMMGEYLLYLDGILFGGIYDNRLLVKITDTNKRFNMSEELPYANAKPMYLVDGTDDKELLKEIVLSTVEGLAKKK